MATDKKPASNAIDYGEVAETIDQLREVCRAGVAGLMSDGFLETEARAIIAGIFAVNLPKNPEDLT